MTPPPPTGRDIMPKRRIEWIVTMCLPYARDLALWSLIDPEEEGLDETLLAVRGLASQCNATTDERLAAFNYIWKRATADAYGTCDHLRRRVHPMAAAKMPEQAIIACARAVLNQHDAYLPDEWLMPILLNIWRGAQRGRARHG